MITKKYLSILALCTLFIANNGLNATTFILKNDSIFNIKYKFADAMTVAQEFILSVGEGFPTNEPKIAIRRSGTGSSYVSNWINVPTIDELANSLSEKEYNEFVNATQHPWGNKTPIISIGSGYTSWKFYLKHTN